VALRRESGLVQRGSVAAPAVAGKRLEESKKVVVNVQILALDAGFARPQNLRLDQLAG
jgi:hypothetical protein